MDKTKSKMSKETQINDDISEDADGTENGTCADSDEEPEAKVAKICTSSTTQAHVLDLVLNKAYVAGELSNTLQTLWSAEEKADFRDAASGVEVFHEPFQICLLPELLQCRQSCRQLVDEMIAKVRWSRKQMDLYEFYQSTDLSSMSECKLLTGFLQMLRRNVRPWLERVTNLKLDYVSASCSMYTCGDYLLVHDDLLKDRQIAFIYYLSPWEGAEQWSEQDGGCLEIFNSDECCFPQFPVARKISPKNNQFAFFKVGSRSFHQVGEVTTFDYPRLTINGWFHGDSNDDIADSTLRPFAKLLFKPPQATEDTLSVLLNEVYLKPATRQTIQKRIEDNSEICLYEFLRSEVFEQALAELRDDTTLQWCRHGPANAHNYEVLELSSASGTLAQLIALFGGTEMFALLRDYTDLDLAGAEATSPSCSLEVQRWSHGNYTVLGDGAICEENTLDLLYYLNAAEGAGVITYLSPEQPDEPASHNGSDAGSVGDDDSVLLTITPVDNSLNVVYRCEGTTKFTKYVSRNTPLEQGPVFVIACSYKE